MHVLTNPFGIGFCDRLFCSVLFTDQSDRKYHPKDVWRRGEMRGRKREREKSVRKDKKMKKNVSDTQIIETNAKKSESNILYDTLNKTSKIMII